MSTRGFPSSRRAFLGGVGAAALSPALKSLLGPVLAHAATGVAPQRLLFIHRPCGTSSLGNGRWWPKGGTTGWTASPLLASFTDGKLASLQDQMVVLKGLTCPRNQNWLGDAHGSGFIGMMTPPVKDTGPSSWPQSASATPSSRNDPNGKTITPADQSIDQLLLSQLAALKGTQIPSVQLAASTESSDQTGDIHALRVTSYARGSGGGAPRPLWPEPSPAVAFQNYFASASMNLTADQAMRAAAQRKSVLDFAQAGLATLRAQVPASQLPKIETHLDAIRQLETTLTPPQGGSGAMACTPPTFPGGPFQPSAPMFSGSSSQGGVTNVGSLDTQTYTMWEQHKEIIKTLFLCDLTRVISFTFAYGNSGIHFQSGVLKDPALAGKYTDPNGAPIGNPNGHHDISHGIGAGAVDAQYIIDKYYCDRTAELLAEMAATPDLGGGSLLDNTLVVFWSEVSDGNSHGIVDMPVALFGGKFLKLRGGSFLQLGDAQTNGQFSPGGHYAKGPAPYTSDRWVTAAQAWGLSTMTAYGDAMWNTGAIPGIFG